MLLSKVIGVIIIARNGDRFSYYQDPKTYAGSSTETTALGEVSSLPTPHTDTPHDPPPRQSLSNSAPSSAPHTSTLPLPPTSVTSTPSSWTPNKSRPSSKLESKATLSLTLPSRFSKDFTRRILTTRLNWQMIRRSSLPWVVINMFQVRVTPLSTWLGTMLIFTFSVETVEPGNDRSLESWTDCPV